MCGTVVGGRVETCHDRKMLSKSKIPQRIPEYRDARPLAEIPFCLSIRLTISQIQFRVRSFELKDVLVGPLEQASELIISRSFLSDTVLFGKYFEWKSFSYNRTRLMLFFVYFS